MSDLSGRILGDYVLREKIGFGGNGDVYRAEHLTLRRTAAIKVLNRKSQHLDCAPERFLREAQLAAKVHHANAAHVYDFGIAEEDGVMWIAMEYVEGISFAKWLQVNGPMPLDKAVPFFVRLAMAVDATHQCKIVHRDLKPSNVMVVKGLASPDREGQRDDGSLASADEDEPKLLDFGIAKGSPAALLEDEEHFEDPGDRVETDLIRAERAPRWRPPTGTDSGAPPGRVRPHEQQLTPRGCGVGSRSYMPPEQWCDASKVGPEADIYALGVMLFEALRGWPPFQANDTDSLFKQHCYALPDPISEEVDRVIHRAMAKEPSDRYASAREFARELQRALQADPTEQIRSLTQQWEAHGRSSDLLARGKTLLELHRSTLRLSVSRSLSKPEKSFIATSLRHARRARWAIGAISALVVMSVLLIRAEGQRHVADQDATEAEVERGQQALLYGKSSEAVRHLEQAYQRGDHSPGVAFMLARALQPRMSELARFTSKSGRMWSAMFAPDGKRVLTADDKNAQMWDAVSSQLLFTMNHGDTVYAAVFSPDGATVITAGGDGTVRIWNAATGAPIRELRHQGADAKRWRYAAVAVSANLVAAVDSTGSVTHVWDAATGTQLAELSTDGPDFYLVAFSTDGRWLATSGRDEVRVFDTSTWRQVVAIPGPRVRSVSFDPTGPRLAVGTYSGAVSIWEVPSGTQLRGLHDAGVSGDAGASVDAVAFSHDGALVATGSRDGTVQIWNAATGTLRIQFHSHRDKIYTVEFSSTGELVLSAGADGAAVVSNVATGLTVAKLEGPKSLLIAAHFDSESHRVVGASWDGTARVWESSSPYRRWGSSPIDASCDNAESLVPDQRFIAVSCGEHGTRVWDTAQGELIAELPSVATVDGNYASALPALTATGDRVAIARGNVVEVYALPSGQKIRTVVHPAAVNAVAFAPAGHDMVTGSIDGSIKVTYGESELVDLPSSSAGIDAVLMLADGRVVVADAGDRLRIISPDHKAVLMDLSVPARLRLLRPSPDGRRLVAISTRNDQSPPMLLNLDQYHLVGQLKGHAGRVFTARFVGDGHEILTAGDDGTARLWDAATGRPRRTLQGDSHFLVDAALSPDGSVIVAGGSDGFLRFWDTASGRLLWMLQAHRSYVVGVHYERDTLVTRGFAGDVARWSLPTSSTIIESCHATACVSVDSGK